VLNIARMDVGQTVVISHRGISSLLVLIEVEHGAESLGYRSILDHAVLPLIPFSRPDVGGDVDNVWVPPDETSLDWYLNRVPGVNQAEKVGEGDVACCSREVINKYMAMAVIAIMPHGAIGQWHIEEVMACLSSMLLHNTTRFSATGGAN